MMYTIHTNMTIDKNMLEIAENQFFDFVLASRPKQILGILGQLDLKSRAEFENIAEAFHCLYVVDEKNKQIYMKGIE